ncbi:hypothetical protein RHGRI_030977 [Rhododendron griersonianum]|uniref:Uncharacterized protein n=1 Tax=Rhododendron griersonianum TaxID=479676 RepID=A0AAV6I628_9ERIC|nr:hypothetical protein RHGRI_030977 [Rhododendron griersonianum]
MLKVWSKKKFGNNKDRINDLKAQLSTIQNNPFSNEGFKQEQEIKKELELTLLREEMYQHQRSRLNWKKFGDKNTAFFHAVVTQRRQRNQLLQIKDRNGSWIKEEREFNSTNLVIIPKVQSPETLSQFRPISLCKFSLKVFTKVMANRLKRILNTIISPDQLHTFALHMGLLRNTPSVP